MVSHISGIVLSVFGYLACVFNNLVGLFPATGTQGTEPDSFRLPSFAARHKSAGGEESLIGASVADLLIPGHIPALIQGSKE
jgi:hypothetical protein